MAQTYKEFTSGKAFKKANPETQENMSRSYFDTYIGGDLEGPAKDAAYQAWVTAPIETAPEKQSALSEMLFGKGGSLKNSAEEAVKGVIQTGVNVANAPVDLLNTGLSALNNVTGSEFKQWDKSVELPDYLKPKDKYVKVAADVAPMLGGGMASMLGKGVVKGAGMAAAALSDQSANEKKVEDFLPQAEAEIKKNPERYKGISAKELAQDFFDADKVANKAIQIGSAATIPVGNTGGILAQMGKQAGIGAALMGGGEAAKQVMQPGEINTDSILGQAATGAAFGAGGGALGGVLGKVGVSADTKAAKRLAKSADEGSVKKIAEGGDVLQKAIRGEDGKSVLTPGQILDKTTKSGKNLLNVEARNRAFDSKSPWNALDKVQDSGSTVRAASDDIKTRSIVSPDGKPIDTSIDSIAKEAITQFRKSATKRYNEAKTRAQGTLTGNGIFEIPVDGSKGKVKEILDKDKSGEQVDLTPEGRKLLRKFNKVKIGTIEQADEWKRRLSEARGKAQKNGDYFTADAMATIGNSLKADVDALIARTNPSEGKIWKEADDFYRTHVGDYDNKSIIGKLSKAENENRAESLLFGAQNGEYNANKVLEALTKTTEASDAALQAQKARINPELEMLKRSGRTDRSAIERALALEAQAINEKRPYVLDFLGNAGTSNNMANAIARTGVSRAVDAAEQGIEKGGINYNKLSNQLEKIGGQAKVADELSALSNRAVNELNEVAGRNLKPTGSNIVKGVKDLQDASLLLGKERTSAVDVPRMGSFADVGWAGVPAALAFAVADGGVSIVTAGASLGLRKAFTNKLFSRMADSMMGRNTQLVKDVEWISNPINAQRVLDEMTGNVKASKLKDEVNSGDISESTVNSALGAMYTLMGKDVEESEDAPEAPQTRSDEVSADDKRKAAREAFLQRERKEAARKAFLEKEAGNKPQAKATVGDKLYTAFASAETGGIEDPYIRTRAQDPSSNRHSSAYGPVQITYTLAEDYLNNKPDLFTKEEKKYLERFVGQGKMMLWNSQGVNTDRTELAYGGQGYLNSPEDKKMYEKVAKKMLVDTFRRNNGNLQATITAWRGIDDPNYANKVAAAL